MADTVEYSGSELVNLGELQQAMEWMQGKVGFDSWYFDEDDNTLHLYDSNGQDLIDPVTINVGSTGVGFTSWDYIYGSDDETENYYLHLYDDEGNDVIDPVYIPGGGGDSSSSYVVRLINQSSSLSMTVASSTTASIAVMFREYYGTEQTSSAGTLTVSYKLSTASEYTTYMETTLAQDTELSIDVTDILTVGSTTNVKVTVKGGESELEKSLNFTIKCVEAYIESMSSAFPSDSLATSVFTGNTTLSYRCIGKGLEKTVYFYIDDELYDSVDVGTSHNTTLTETLTLTKYSYGTHDLKYWFETTDGAASNVLHNVIMYDDGTGSDPMISVICDEDEIQYGEEISLDYVVYTPDQETTDELNIRLYAIESGEEVEYASSSLVDVENQVLKTWTCTEYPESGTVYVEFTSGNTTVTLELTITELDTDYAITTVESGLVYLFTASGKSNNDTDKEEFAYEYTDANETTTSIKGVNTGFNWVSNGYLSTDYGMALRMSGGAAHEIQIPIFTTSYTDDDGQTVKLDSASGATVTTNGRTLEFDFMSSLVTDRNAVLVSCMTDGVGFVITPQVCYLLSTNGDTVELDDTGFIENEESIAAAYLQPEKKIHLAFVVEAVNSSNQQCVNIYLNGKLSNSLPYDNTDSFTQKAYISMGTDSCIFDLFNVKLYNRALTEAEIRQNYVASANTIAERLALAEFDDVLDDDGNVSYELCRERYNCLLAIGDLSPLKTTKAYAGLTLTLANTIGSNDGYTTAFELNGTDSNGRYYCNNKVQGTSSVKFILKNFKFYLVDDTGAKYKYPIKGYDEDGNALSVKESTLCWKADYMSSDHANTYNANLADTLFLDTTEAQEENSLIQNCVYGIQCLLFVEDPDTGEITFYADGMLNNDKGNSKSFGLECDDDDGNDTTRQKWEYLTNSSAVCMFQTDALQSVLSDGTTTAVYEALESCYPDQGDLEDAGLSPNYDHIQVLYTWVCQRANFWTASTESGTGGTYNDVEYDTEREYRKAIFYAEFSTHFNLLHALTYYNFIECVALCDNRAKNMFLRCENVKAENIVFTDDSYTSISDIIDSDGNVNADAIDWDNSTFGVWITDLYDLDSCYGAENSGYLRIPYYAEWDYQLNDTNQFNGYNSYLWLMFEEAFASEIQSNMKTLASYLNYDVCYNLGITNGTELMCPAIVNYDMTGKYKDAWTEGYLDYSTSEDNPSTLYTSMYMYLNRDGRIYQKGDFMQNRFNMMYSKYQTTQFTQDTLNFRASTQDSSGTIDAEDTALTITAAQAMYLAVRYADSSDVYITNGKIAAGESTTIYANGSLGHSDTVYIAGASVLTDVGDLSKLRPYEFQCNRATKLKVLNIGSDEDGYTNTQLDSLDVTSNTLLTILNVMGCTKLTGTLDLSSNGLIEEVYTENSGVSYVKLPNGGVLNTLHLNAPSTITVQNMTLLEDFSCADYSSLKALQIENTPNIPTDEIVSTYLTQLTNGLRLVGVEWELEDTTLLELLISSDAQGKYMNSSGVKSDDDTAYPYISGTATISSIGTSLLATLAEIYPYLTIAYTQAVTQYTVTFVDWDGTVLNTQYIDSGGAAEDPVETGLIDTPTRDADESYYYTYSGWDKTFDYIVKNTTVTAQYTTENRVYTVTWVNIDGTVLDEQTCNYGDELSYSGGTPTYTAYESINEYYLFHGWDMCTGYITEDTTVTAQYVNSNSHEDKDSTEMNAADVWYYAKTGQISDTFAIKDRIPMKMGYLPDYENLEYVDFVDGETYFDGETYVDTGYQLLADDSTWTLVVDGMFYDTTTGQVLVGCMDEDSYYGIQFRYNNGLAVRWGANSVSSGRTTYRDIIVVRHTEGNLYVTAYVSKPNSDTYEKQTVTKTLSNITTAPLTLGANINEDGTVTSYATGVLYACRLYKGDVGDAEAKKMVAWPLEDQQIEVTRQGGAYSDPDGNETDLDFIFASSLSCVRQMNTSADNTGGWAEMPLRTWLQSRVFNAMPPEWQQIVCTIVTKQIETTVITEDDEDTEDDETVLSSDVQQTEDTLTLANYYEVSNTSSDPWAGLGKYISYFTSNAQRIAFRNIIIPEDAQYITYGTDPTEDSDYTVKDGDVWINTSNSSVGYIWHNDRWTAANAWWLRDSSTSGSTSFAYVYNNGNANSTGYTASYTIAVRPRFSIRAE